MKKALFVLVVFALVFGSVMPVLAQDVVVPVQANVPTGSGSSPTPVVIGAWIASPGDSDPGAAGAQVIPNAGAPGTVTPICLNFLTWTADTGGLDGSFVKVYHPAPDSSFKVQIDNVQGPWTGPDAAGWLAAANTAGLVDWNWTGAGAAYPAGPGITTPGQAVTLLDNGHMQLWKVCFDYQCNQAPGWYQFLIKLSVNGVYGEWWSRLSLEVEELFSFAKDFSVVNWGPISANSLFWVAGDDLMSTPALPTVHANGNVPVLLKVRFSPLVQTSGEDPKVITHFDIKTYSGTFDPIMASTDPTYWYPLTGFVLPPCSPKKMDFSVHTPTFLDEGTYEGTLHILAYAPNS